MVSYEDLKSELIEISKVVEKFPEAVKPMVYDLLVAQYLGEAPVKPDLPVDKPPRTKTKTKRAKAKQKGGTETKAKRSASKESYSIDRHLNLQGDGSIPSFKEFYAEKAPSTGKEINTVAVYYLRKVKGLEEITLDHVYTCYSEVKKKPPKAFRQSFNDIKNKEGWLEFDENGNLDIPHRGVVYVEHDLPKATS